MEQIRRQMDADQREANISSMVPEFVKILDKAFKEGGLVKTKAMSTLVQEIVLTQKSPSIEKTAQIIRDFGEFSRQAGLGPEPLKAKKNS
jgi:hypothetical protein